MSFLDTLSEVWDKITAWLKNIGEDVMDFLEPLAREIAQNGGIVLMEIAEQAVLSVEQGGGSGEDKFSAAKKIVLNGLKEQGIPVVINAVHGAIESAVAKMKAGR